VSAAGHDLRSLDDIEGTTWGPAPEDATTLVTRIHQLRATPVGALTGADLRLLIGQQVGSDVLVPQVLALLKREPLVETDFYPGDLLAAVLRLPPPYWQRHPALVEEMRAVLDSVDELPSELATGVASFRRAV
jgi:hypothetical protein